VATIDAGERIPRRQAPTIADVAREARVSRAAVSKVLRNAYGVSEEMHQRVQTAIEQLDYRPRVAARSMRGSSYTTGLEIPQITNDFLTMIVHGALEAIEGTPYRLIVGPVTSPADSQQGIESLADRQVDALISVVPLTDRAWLERMSTRTPTVIVGSHEASPCFDTVVGADETGAHLVMDHLFDLGHRHIAHLTRRAAETPQPADPRDWLQTGHDPHDIRGRVYLERMRERGYTPIVLTTGAEELEARAAWSEFLDTADHPTALFAGNDTLAIGALRANVERGLGPEVISVVGYDNTTIASHPALSLTSVDQSGHSMGRESVRLLMERLEGRKESVLVEEPVTLKVRSSTTRPRQP